MDINSDSMTYEQLTRLMMQRSKIVHCKIEVLDINDNIVNEIKGFCQSGNISINVDNMVRRTLNATFIAHEKLEVREQSLIWINKRLKFYIGIEKYSKDIVWFNMGIYIISNPETLVNNNGRTISIQGYDKMRLFEQRPFMYDTSFSAGTPIHEVIKGLGKLVGETKFLVEENSYTLPYRIQVAPDDDLATALQDVTNLYMNYHTYYNVDGYLVYEKTKNKINDPVIWEFIDDRNMTISRNIITDYDNIKNYIKTLGGHNQYTGVQPKYEIKISGKNNVFSIDNIGERAVCFIEDKYTTQEQCRLKCEYEQERVQNLTNVFDITFAPLLILNDVNKVIKVKDNGIIYTCALDNLEIPLDSDGEMSLQCHQIFD